MFEIRHFLSFLLSDPCDGWFLGLTCLTMPGPKHGLGFECANFAFHSWKKIGRRGAAGHAWWRAKRRGLGLPCKTNLAPQFPSQQLEVQFSVQDGKLTWRNRLAKDVNRPRKNATGVRNGPSLDGAVDFLSHPSGYLETTGLITMWGHPVISWFINPSNYSYKML